jgi:predicted Zn-dependent protease
MLQFDLARVQIETGNPEEARAAVATLERVARVERSNPDVWRYLATAYDRSGQPGPRDVALAERELAMGNGQAARALAERALRLLPVGSPMYLRAQDVIGSADNARQRR